jgi:hypothetical protein
MCRVAVCFSTIFNLSLALMRNRQFIIGRFLRLLDESMKRVKHAVMEADGDHK